MGSSSSRRSGSANSAAASATRIRQPPEKLASGRALGVLVEAQAVQDRARPRRRGMGADVGEPGLDLGDRGGILHPLGRRQQALALAVGGEHRLRAGSPRRPAPPARPSRRCAPRRRRTSPASGAELAPDQPQQRGLAAAVAPDQADPVAGRQVDARALEQQLAADPQADVVQVQHGGRGIARRAACPTPAHGSAGCVGRAAGLAMRECDVQFCEPIYTSKGATLRTNIEIDDALLAEAMAATGLKTKRKRIDLLIGTWCIAEECALLHRDRDFDPLTRHLGLRSLGRGPSFRLGRRSAARPSQM